MGVGGTSDGRLVPRRDGCRLRALGGGPGHRQPHGRDRGPARRARPGRALDAQPARPGRGRDRDREDQDPSAPRGPALPGWRPGADRRHQGRPDRPRPARRRDQREGPGARGGARLGIQARWPPGRVPLALGPAGRAGPGDGPLVRAAPAGPGPRPQRHADQHPVARLQVLRRPPAAAARPRGPHDHAQVPGQRRRQGDPGRLRRHLAGEPRSHPPLDHHARAAGRGRLLRGAGVRRRRPDADDARAGRGSSASSSSPT